MKRGSGAVKKFCGRKGTGSKFTLCVINGLLSTDSLLGAKQECRSFQRVARDLIGKA